MRYPWVFLALASFVLSGCENAATTPGANTTDATTAAPADVELTILSYDEIQELIADKQGKVVVVDAWATSCPPCLKDFHNLVELHEQYGPDQLACISLSFDYEGIGEPQDVSEPVLNFLRSQGAAFDNVMSSEESDVLYRKFDLNSVPAIFVYNRAGELQERFVNEGAYEQVRPLVAELIAESTPVDSGAAEGQL